MSAVTPLRRGRPASDAELGMAWFNSMNERQRLEALRAADSDCPADAWAYFKATGGFKCEGSSHG
jgi:hypothetical protein